MYVEHIYSKLEDWLNVSELVHLCVISSIDGMYPFQPFLHVLLKIPEEEAS